MTTYLRLSEPFCLVTQNGSLSRRGAVIINRLQIGHTRATHAHLLGDDDEAVCTTCYTSLTVNHIPSLRGR